MSDSNIVLLIIIVIIVISGFNVAKDWREKGFQEGYKSASDRYLAMIRYPNFTGPDENGNIFWNNTLYDSDDKIKK